MGRLLHHDMLFRLAASVRESPEQWLSRLIFLLGPWESFWMVEILNGNDVFSDLYPWQVLMNLIWYYLLFLLCRLVLGRRRRAAAGLCTGERNAFTPIVCKVILLDRYFLERLPGTPSPPGR